MNNAKPEYVVTESYKICNSSPCGKEHAYFTLYRGRIYGYKGWYLKYTKEKYPATCYEYYKIIKDIFNGEVNGINQKIKEIRVVLSDNFALQTMTPEWTDEEIFKELSDHFWKD